MEVVTFRPALTKRPANKEQAVANLHSIEPFPSTIDRFAFGHYLSGLTDGEGSFVMDLIKPKKAPVICRCRFIIVLRFDDLPILNTIQSYWGCGIIGARKGYRTVWPQRAYYVLRVGELKNIVVRHYELFPLRAKKARDFEIWKEGVELIYKVMQRGRKGHMKRAIGGKGSGPIWTVDERNHFASLKKSMEAQRRADSGPIPIPIPGRTDEPNGLLDTCD